MCRGIRQAMKSHPVASTHTPAYRLGSGHICRGSRKVLEREPRESLLPLHIPPRYQLDDGCMLRGSRLSLRMEAGPIASEDGGDSGGGGESGNGRW